MKEVKRDLNWRSVDTLDGVDLKQGELVVVAWPDGTETAEIINLDRPYTTYSDHGHVHELPCSHAWCKTEYNGHPAKVYLRGLQARRV